MEAGDGVKTLKQDPLFVKFSAVLPSAGAIVDEIREEIPESVVSRYFGPKASKSGWKYAKYTTTEEASAIYDLWTRVYDDLHVPNKEISLQFARGLILQQTQPVNWAEFAVRRQRYREALRESKKSGGKGDNNSEVLGVQVLGKKRFGAPLQKNALIPAALKLTLKEEVEEEVAMGKKGPPVKGKGSKGKGEEVGPCWVESELLNMQVVIETTESLLVECKKKFEESSAEVDGLEGQARRVAFMLSDRVVMLEDNKRELSNICEQQALLESRIAEKESSLCKSGCSELQSSELLRDDKLQIDHLSLSQALALKTVAHCSTVILGCRADVASVEDRLLESSERQKNVESRVRGLGFLLVGMHDQLRKMDEGSGHAFFPRPLANNPERPLRSIHVLNACPVCGFWYSANNFVPLCCGHTYHLFCLSEHAKKSSACCFLDCKQEFSTDTLASIGIRPPQLRSSMPECAVKSEGALKKDSGNFSSRFQTLGLGSKPSSPSTNILAHVSRPTLQEGCATPRTSTPTTHISEPSSESLQRTEETTNHIHARKRSPALENNSNSGGIDNCGPRSFSELDLAPHNGFIQSQSSVNNEDSEKTMAPNSRTTLLCTMCKNKPSAVSLTACGHDSFCFKCISGLEKCPLCMKEIVGWIPVLQNSNVHPSLFSRGGAIEKEAAPEESDNDSAGLVDWCNEDVFSQGGMQTVVGGVANEKSELEVTTVVAIKEVSQEERPHEEAMEVAGWGVPAPKPQRTFSRRAMKIVPVEELMVTEVETQSAKPAAVISKKRGRLSVDVETLNHTRVMERPLTEILVAAPLAVDLGSKTGRKKAQPASTCGSKRLQIGATRGNQCRLTVPAKFRD